MNKKDAYWFWVMRAISEPDISYNKHYYNIDADRLFSLRHNGQKLVPWCHNLHSDKENVNTLFAEELSKIGKPDPGVIHLPKLTIEVKKNFMDQFISQICEQFAAIKKNLLVEVADFSAIDEFHFKMPLRNQAPSLYFEFESQKRIFVAEQVTHFFEPLGISEQSSVIW